MYDLKDIKNRRYGVKSSNPYGTKYKEGYCAYEVFTSDGWTSYQCKRKNGHGKMGLFCKQHAKIV